MDIHQRNETILSHPAVRKKENTLLIEKKVECFCRRYIFRQLHCQISLRRTPLVSALKKICPLFEVEYINVGDFFISFARQESVNQNQNNKATFTQYRITFGEHTTSIRYVTLHLRDQRGTASLHLTEIAPKSPFLCVN